MNERESSLSAPSVLTPGEVCARLRVSRQTLATWAREGQIPAITLPGGHRRYRLEDIEAIERGQHREASA